MQFFVWVDLRGVLFPDYCLNTNKTVFDGGVRNYWKCGICFLAIVDSKNIQIWEDLIYYGVESFKVAAHAVPASSLSAVFGLPRFFVYLQKVSPVSGIIHRRSFADLDISKCRTAFKTRRIFVQIHLRVLLNICMSLQLPLLQIFLTSVILRLRFSTQRA